MSDKPSFLEMMKMAKNIQKTLRDTQKEMKAMRIEGEAGAGLVKVTLNGQHEVLDVQIDDQALSEDKTVLQTLIASAFNAANHKLEQANKARVGDLTKGMNLPGDMLPPSDE